jgi:glutamine synthetase
VNLVYSQRNRSAAVRIPVYSKNPQTKRIEFRCPDPACNPYLCFAAQLMAGLDAIRNRIDPGDPIDKDLYELNPGKRYTSRAHPALSGGGTRRLEKDHEWLLPGSVFTLDVVKTWLRYKRECELAPASLRPVPFEFHLYFDL